LPYAFAVDIYGWIAIVVAALAAAAVTVFLVRQWRMERPTPLNLRRAGDENRDDYSTREQGHDIAMSFVERGGEGGAV
jgi:hypothetical protein